MLILKRIINYKLSDYFNQILKPLFILVLCTALIPIIPRVLLRESLLRFILVGFLSVVSVVLGIYYIVLNQAEKCLIFQMLTKFIKQK